MSKANLKHGEISQVNVAVEVHICASAFDAPAEIGTSYATDQARIIGNVESPVRVAITGECHPVFINPHVN